MWNSINGYKWVQEFYSRRALAQKSFGRQTNREMRPFIYTQKTPPKPLILTLCDCVLDHSSTAAFSWNADRRRRRLHHSTRNLHRTDLTPTLLSSSSTTRTTFCNLRRTDRISFYNATMIGVVDEAWGHDRRGVPPTTSPFGSGGPRGGCCCYGGGGRRLMVVDWTSAKPVVGTI